MSALMVFTVSSCSRRNPPLPNFSPNAVSRNSTSSTVSIESIRPDKISELSSPKGLVYFFCARKFWTNSRINCFESFASMIPSLADEEQVCQETQINDQRKAVIGDREDAEQAIEEADGYRGAKRAPEESRWKMVSFAQARDDQRDRKHNRIEEERLKRTQGRPEPHVVDEKKFAGEMKEGIADASGRKNRKR